MAHQRSSSDRGREVPASSPPSAHESDNDEYVPADAVGGSASLSQPAPSQLDSITVKRRSDGPSGPAGKRRRERPPVSEGDNETSQRNSVRLGQCMVIRHIDINYAQKNILPAKREVVRELFQAGRLTIFDKPSQTLKTRDLAQVNSVLQELVRKDCPAGTSFEDFCKNPTEVLSDGVLRKIRYDEYCASVKESSAADHDAEVPSGSPGHSSTPNKHQLDEPTEPSIHREAREACRLGKCKIIHLIDTTYYQKSLEPPPYIELANEVHRRIPGLLYKDKASQQMKPRDATQVLRLMRSIAKEDCQVGTDIEDFCRNPVGSLKPGRLNYEEYCASVEDPMTIEDRDEVTPSPSDAHTDHPYSQSSNAAPLLLPKLSSFTIGKAGLKYSTRQSAMAGKQRVKDKSDAVDDSPPRPQSIGRATNSPSARMHNEIHVRHSNGPQQSLIENPQSGDDEMLSQESWPVEDAPGSSLHGHSEGSQQKQQNKSEVERIGREARQWTEAEVESIEAKVRQRLGSEVMRIESDFEKRVQSQVEKRIKAAAPLAAAFNRIMPDATDYHVNTDRLARDFQKMFSQSKSRVHQAFAARGVALGEAASFIVYPPSNVQQLYSMVTGAAHAGQSSKIAIVSSLSAQELALSLFGAFLVRCVFCGSLVETFHEFQEKFGCAVNEVDQVLQEHQTNRDTVLRKAYLLRLLNKDWQEHTFRQMAEMISEDFAVRLEQHLGVQHGLNGQTYGPSMYSLASRFSMMIFDALVLQCEIDSARESTEILWYYSGEEIDPDTTEASADNHTRVVLTLFPGLSIGGPYPEVVFKAQVESSE